MEALAFREKMERVGAPGSSLSAGETLFYDGTCGLCHGTVRWVLAEDRAGTRFRFAPLDGETFRRVFSAEERAALPDSLVVRTNAGTTLIRSEAVQHVAGRLGGFWSVLGQVSRLVPRMLLDRLYDGVAAIRHRLFARPSDSCPVVPPHLQDRFDP